MEWFNILMARLRALFQRESVLRDIEEELRIHVEMETEENIRRAMAPDEARARALKTFGDLVRNTERGYDIRGGGWLETLWHDLRYGLRIMLKNPGFTLIAALTLALGIGANTAIFSLIDAALLRGLPYREPERVAVLWNSNPPMAEFPPSNADVAAWREGTQSFAHVAGFTWQNADLAEYGDPERVGGAAVTPEFFQVIGVNPFLGRVFTLEEIGPGAANVGLISHSLWQRRFGSDPGILGGEIMMNGEKLTVVGVLPPGFDFPRGSELPAIFPFASRTDIWTPVKWDTARLRSRANYAFVVLGRLKPGVSLGQAQAEMGAYAARQAKEFPDALGDGTIRVVSLPEQVAGKSRTALLALFAAVGLLLLIACVNVANLLLARGAARRRELAIRAALGAEPGRVIRQLLTESILLSALGGGLGLLFARWCIGLVLSLRPANLPRLENVSLNITVLMFTAFLSMLTGVVFALIPAFQMTRDNLRDSLSEGGRGSESGAGHALRNWLIAGEVALAIVLLVGAGLLMRSLRNIQAIDPGFKAASALVFDVSLPASRYPDDARQVDFYRRLLTRLEALPTVRAAGAASFLPLGGGENFAWFSIEDAPVTPGQEPTAQRRVVTPGYFAALGIAVQSGRTFTARDDSSQPPVVVINETMARQFFGAATPVGRRLRLGRAGGNDPWRTVVGVVRDVKSQALEAAVLPQLYLPLEQWSRSEMSFALKVDGDPLALVPAIRAETKALDPYLPLAKIRTMPQVVAAATSPRRFNALLMGLFAGTALLLTLVGLYGVISYLVGLRIREIGVRMALGAERSDILRLILAQAMKPVGVGTATGLLAAFALTRLMKTMLFGVSATDPLTFIAIALSLAGAALLAALAPALQATKVDPLTALRQG
jgi:putative ABC transport system permease protein